MPNTKPLRAAIYLRVSTQEQVRFGYSLDAQDRINRQLAALRGWPVVKAYADEGESAKYDDPRKRPGFLAAMQEAGTVYDVLIVWAIHRFARNLLLQLQSFSQLYKQGASIVFVEGNADYTTPDGRLFLSITGAVAEWYSLNLARETRKGKQERKRQGLYNGHLPFGCIKGEDGLPTPDPNTHTALLRMFEIARDESLFRAAQWLNQHNYRLKALGKPGHPPSLFTNMSVSRLCRNRLFVGELPDGNGGWMPGKHAPIVPLELFEQARESIDGRKDHCGPGSVNSVGVVYALSGLLVCGECGSTCGIRKEISHRKWLFHYVRCRKNEIHRACPQGRYTYSHYKEQFRDYLHNLSIPTDEAIAGIERRLAQQHQQMDVDAERRRLQEYLKRRQDLYSLGDITRTQYLAERADVQRQLEALSRSAPHTDLKAIATQLRRIPELWDEASEVMQHEMATLLVQRIIIKGKKIIEIIPTEAARPLLEH
jgi:site-specific DNA recombinase